MPELLVINPVKRRRAKNPSKARRSPAQRAATARMLAANRRANPAKRRRARRRNPVATVAGVRSAARRNIVRRNPARRHSRRRRNPLPSMRSIGSSLVPMIKNAAIGGAGAIGVDFIMGKINAYLPVSMQPTNEMLNLNDAIKVGVTMIAGKLLSKATRGMSEKAAVGALTVQAYGILAYAAQMYAPGLLAPATGTTVNTTAGIGYAVPNRVVRGNSRISPIQRPRMAAFAPGASSPALSAFAPGVRSPSLAGYGSRRR